MTPDRLLRSALALGLALVVALTSGAMAVARGQTHAAGQIVICTALGVTTIAVDDAGQPVGPPHICPDCALHLFGALDAPAGGPAPAPRAALIQRPPPAAHVVLAPLDPPRARGPPVS